jgi:L-lactate dehydrogenase complex protein LldF
MTPTVQRAGLGFWAWFAKRPALYQFATRWAMRAMRASAGNRGRFKSLPLAGGWTRHRDFPAPQGRTFQDQWRARKNGAAR